MCALGLFPFGPLFSIYLWGPWGPVGIEYCLYGISGEWHDHGVATLCCKDIFIHSFIHSSSSSSLFFRACNRSPLLGGAVSGSFLLVARTMTKDITCEDIGRLNTVQLIAPCRVHSIGYADKATQSKKTNDAKRDALWANLPKTSETT